MDGYNEKKWFVYLGDHHEGPFSLADIDAKMSSSQVTSGNFVWCEGMPDWKVMTEVPQFGQLLQRETSLPPLDVGVQASVAAGAELAGPVVDRTSTVITLQEGAGTVVEPDLIEQSQSPVRIEPAAPVPAAVGAPDVVLAEAGTARVELATNPHMSLRDKAEEDAVFNRISEVREKPKRSGGLLRLMLLLLTLGAGGYAAYSMGYLNEVIKSPVVKGGIQTAGDALHPYLLKAIDKYPPMARWISPLPSLEDVELGEYEELKAAAAFVAPGAAPKLAVALSKADPLAPSFYVAANLPDGTELEVFLVGIPETLLNATSYSTQAKVQVSKRLGKTGTIRLPEGQAIPKGQYHVYVMEAEAEKQPETVRQLLASFPVAEPLKSEEAADSLPKGRRLMTAKSYFLGGPKDAVYAERLKAHHDKLAADAAQQLGEIKQFKSSLDGQLMKLMTKYSQLRLVKGKLLPRHKTEWNSLSTAWKAFDRALDPAFQLWTPEKIPNNFYSALIPSLIQGRQAVQEVFNLQNGFYGAGLQIAPGADIQIEAAASKARSILTALAAKIEKAEKLGTTPNGMPRRDGL